MQMMYDIIAQELKSLQLKDAHPQDYLNFYCLGNREEPLKEVSLPNTQASDGVNTHFLLVSPNIFNLLFI